MITSRKNKYLSIISFIVFSSYSMCNLSAQESWIINDQDFNGAFIAAYNEALFSVNENATEQDIVLEDNVLVVDINNNILDITSSGADGAKILNKDIIKNMPQDMVSKLRKRKYDWDHLDWKKFMDFKILGRNAYEYANFKEIRDTDWWTRNILSLTPFTTNIYIARPAPGLLALGAYQGYSEIGYPISLSKNARLFAATETAKVFFNIPYEYDRNRPSNVHPIESAYGGGLSFNIDNIGGMVGLNILNKADYIDYYEVYDPQNTVYNSWAGLIYWTRSQKFKLPVSGKNSKDHPRAEPLIPDGVQTFKFGPAYTKLTYGKIDSISGFTAVESTDWGDSFSLLFEWTYLSDKVHPEGSYNYYHKWAANFRTYLLGVPKVSFELTYSLRSGFALGFKAAWADQIAFLKGKENEFVWKPGFVITPTLTKRF